jgi:hypothetical protein
MGSNSTIFREGTTEIQETSPSSASSTDTTTLYPVVLPHPYVDRTRLLRKLRSRFGEDKFRVQVFETGYKASSYQTINTSKLRLNQWTIFVPEALSEAGFTFFHLSIEITANILRMIEGNEVHLPHTLRAILGSSHFRKIKHAGRMIDYWEVRTSLRSSMPGE